MSGKIALVIVLLLAIGVLVLPSTVSLFAGQHYWYDLEAQGNQVPCQKCHADVFEELNNSPYHLGQGTPGVADEQDCTFCHQANTSITYASADGAGAQMGEQAHAASTIQCMYCHGNQAIGAPLAGGFGLTGLANDTGTYAAHSDFVQSAAFSEPNTGEVWPLLGENEACIACHTHVAVKINFTHYKAMEFNVSFDTASNMYSASGFKINTSTEVTNTIWGNATGSGWTSYPGSAKWP